MAVRRWILLPLLALGTLLVSAPAHAAEIVPAHAAEIVPVHAADAAPANAAITELEISVRGEDPAKPVVVLTNKGEQPCQIVGGSALGTVALTRVEQGGKAIEPLPTEVSFPDGLPALMTQRVQTLAPGKSVELPLPVMKGGPTGLALEMVTWSEATGTYAALFPLKAGEALTLEVTYSVPLKGDFCAAAMNFGQAGAGSSRTQNKMIWVIGAGAAVLLIGAVLALVLLRRKKSTGVATVILLVAGLGITIPQEPAHATITTTDPSIQSAFDTCMASLHQPGHDPAGILPALEAAGVNVTVQRPTTPSDTHETAVDGKTIFIFWDPDDTHKYFGTGGNADPCTSLYHEFHHGWQHNQGTYSMSPCATSDRDGRTLPRTEVDATRAQNLLREALGLPQRSHYGDVPLPSGDCQPPEPPGRCTGASCGDSNGDPHLLTFDNKRYDFQAAGEFVLSRQTGGGFEVQVRQEPAAGSRLVALNTAVAMSVGTERVEIRMTGKGMTLLVAGATKPLENQKLSGGEIKANAASVQVSWKDGPQVFARPIGRWGLHVAIGPALDQAGKLEGLLGNYDGDAKNDVPSTAFEDLYPGYADKWRIDGKSSLFTYEAGKSTESYVDRKFPDRAVTLESLPGRAAAEALCRRQGVTDPEVLANCILDVALTGQADFAAAAASGLEFIGGPEFGGIPFTVRLTKAGEKVTVEFDGTQGQQVFIYVPVSTLPNTCGGLLLLAPDGKTLGSGCIINGVGNIDSTTLPVTGKYRISVEARNGIGEARLRVITIKNQTGSLVPDAAPTLVRIDKPGMTGRFTFTGRKDQKVYVDVTRSTLRNECGLLSLAGPDGRNLRTGCVINGIGELDSTVLPADGTYTVLVDPDDHRVGDATIRLINAIDQLGTITIDGPPVSAKIGQPGASSTFTFAATAGQRVFVTVTSPNLPNQCGILALRDPLGGPTVTGCVINGKGGIAERDGYELKLTGTYTIVLDPSGNRTGDATIRLTTRLTGG